MFLQTQCSSLKYKHISFAVPLGNGSFACVEDWVETIYLSIVNVNKRKYVLEIKNVMDGCPYSVDAAGDFIMYVHETEFVYTVFIVYRKSGAINKFYVGPDASKNPTLVEGEQNNDNVWACNPTVAVFNDGGFVFVAKQHALVVDSKGKEFSKFKVESVRTTWGQHIVCTSDKYVTVLDKSGIEIHKEKHNHRRSINCVRGQSSALSVYSRDRVSVWSLPSMKMTKMLPMDSVKQFDISTGAILTNYWLHAGEHCVYTRAFCMEDDDTVGLPWEWERELWKGNHCSRSLLSKLSRDVINQILSMFKGITLLERSGLVRSYLVFP